MRRRIQQSCRKLVSGNVSRSCTPTLLFFFSLAVYALTMDRSVSWWDCGEFITTGYGLQVGHPPGAPFYQLVTHCFMLLSFGNPLWVAPLSNFVSVLCASFTVLILYKTILLLLDRPATDGHHSTFKTQIPALIGALCYLFCDTAWFSAVESEVYSMAMLFCALDVWLILLWRRNNNPRLLLLLALLLGLGVCVHLMTLLVVPTLLWIYLRSPRTLKHFCLAIPFFLLGLSPYAIVPIRAAANPPVNQMGDSFIAYVKRDQYPKAPLYPRLWRERDAKHWADWIPTDTPDTASLVDNSLYYLSYQFGYMYCRYLMYNYIGRENLKHHRTVVFILPFLLGLAGLVTQWRRRRRSDLLFVTLLFLFGGIVLNIYLNHPCYEPRERDYAYILSFYAFAIWIGIGVSTILRQRWQWLMLLAPMLMALGNWSDHNRSHCHSVHDIALNHLQSCDSGAILLAFGDNDTFPLWYLQQVEHHRTDIDIHNINLEGYRKTWQMLDSNNFQRPVYLTQYACDRLAQFYPGRLRCEGFCWRLLPSPEGADDTRPLQRHIAQSIQWNITPSEYLDPVSRSFLNIWLHNTTARPLP